MWNVWAVRLFGCSVIRYVRFLALRRLFERDDHSMDLRELHFLALNFHLTQCNPFESRTVSRHFELDIFVLAFRFVRDRFS